MGMSGGPSDLQEDEVVSAINTTPLVDVMLVLLIIFLITIPVATHTVRLKLPEVKNHPTQTKPGNVFLAITADGQIFWDQEPVADRDVLLQRLERLATKSPQPQIQIRGDIKARYDSVGRVLAACQEAGISRVDFITERPRG